MKISLKILTPIYRIRDEHVQLATLLWFNVLM